MVCLRAKKAIVRGLGVIKASKTVERLNRLVGYNSQGFTRIGVGLNLTQRRSPKGFPQGYRKHNRFA